MKLRVFKWQIAKVLNWYNEQLSALFLNQFLTEATVQSMKYTLKNIQSKQIYIEPHNQVWQVPIDVRKHPTDPTVIEIYISDESNVLYIE